VLAAASGSFAQCGAINFEVSALGIVPNAFAYRAAIDFNGDGRLDFAGDSDNPSPQINNVTVLQNNGAGNFTPITLSLSNGAGGSFFGADWADFNADGRPDALAYFSTAPNKVIYYNNGDGTMTRAGALAFDSPYEYVSGAADVNRDGRVDFITTGPPNAGADEPNYYLYLSAGNGAYAPRTLIATEHANLFFGDFNGDGRSDIAVYRASEGNWYYLKSSDNQFAVFHWGIATDKPVPADYDGDGKNDLAVFRQSEGNWYVLRSASNSFSSAHWGADGDLPLAFDTDGDGAFEFGVYRPNENRWFVAPSVNVAFGAPGDVPVSLN
jgi:hypothetical protein